MQNENFDFELRRLKLVEACAYYVQIKGISVDQLEITKDLSDLITERFRAAKLEWSIGSRKLYTSFLEDGMNETLPDVDEGDFLSKSMVRRFNFRSLVAKEVHDKRVLFSELYKVESKDDANGNEVCHIPGSIPQTFKTSAAPHDFLMGFTMHIQPDAALDDMIPICARDQHLLNNIFGDKWKSPTVINAYVSIKGQTGIMQKWSQNSNGQTATGKKPGHCYFR